MLSYKMDFSSCNIMPGFGKSSHIFLIIITITYFVSGDCKMYWGGLALLSSEYHSVINFLTPGSSIDW